MATINEIYKSVEEKIAQAERQKRLKENREKAKQRKTDFSRQIIVGKMVIESLPMILKLQPQLTKAKNKIEFAPLTEFLIILAADKEYSELLKKLINEKNLSDKK